MSDSYSTKRNVPFLTEFSPKDAQLAHQAASDYEERQRKAQDAHAQQARSILEDARRQVRDLLGHTAWVSLRKSMRQQHLDFRALLQPPEGTSRSYEDLNKARKNKIDALLRDLGISREQLGAIGAEFQEGLRDVMLTPPGGGQVVPGYNLPNNLDKWKDLSPLHQHPLPWGDLPVDGGSDDPYRWFLYRPPFWGFNFSFVPVTSDGFRVDRVHNLQPAAGFVGHDVTMDLDDADDHDFAEAVVDTQIAFGFETLATGPVEVLVDAQNVIGTHDLRTQDEWGWSNSFTSQRNYLMMQVLHPDVPEPSLALMSELYCETDDDTTVHREYLTLGEHYYAHFITAGSVPAGQSIVICVGTRNWDMSGSNDVGIDSDSSFNWLIKSIEVRIRQTL